MRKSTLVCPSIRDQWIYLVTKLAGKFRIVVCSHMQSFILIFQIYLHVCIPMLYQIMYATCWGAACASVYESVSFSLLFPIYWYIYFCFSTLRSELSCHTSYCSPSDALAWTDECQSNLMAMPCGTTNIVTCSQLNLEQGVKRWVPVSRHVKALVGDPLSVIAQLAVRCKIHVWNGECRWNPRQVH